MITSQQEKELEEKEREREEREENELITSNTTELDLQEYLLLFDEQEKEENKQKQFIKEQQEQQQEQQEQQEEQESINIFKERNSRENKIWNEKSVEKLMKNLTDPIGKFLRDLRISPSDVIELEIMPLLDRAPRKSRAKYGKRKLLTVDERAELNRKRNREHARATRLRRKIFETVLESQLHKIRQFVESEFCQKLQQKYLQRRQQRVDCLIKYLNIMNNINSISNSEYSLNNKIILNLQYYSTFKYDTTISNKQSLYLQSITFINETSISDMMNFILQTFQLEIQNIHNNSTNNSNHSNLRQPQLQQNNTTANILINDTSSNLITPSVQSFPDSHISFNFSSMNDLNELSFNEIQPIHIEFHIHPIKNNLLLQGRHGMSSINIHINSLNGKSIFLSIPGQMIEFTYKEIKNENKDYIHSIHIHLDIHAIANNYLQEIKLQKNITSITSSNIEPSISYDKDSFSTSDNSSIYQHYS